MGGAGKWKGLTPRSTYWFNFDPNTPKERGCKFDPAVDGCEIRSHHPRNNGKFFFVSEN